MINQNDSNAYRETKHGQLIESVREIRGLSNTSITTGVWSAIVTPCNCKAVIAQTRNANAWLLATSDGASVYMTIDSVLELSIAQAPSETLFYAKAAATNDTLEVLFLD